jgi:hypothetical protein
MRRLVLALCLALTVPIGSVQAGDKVPPKSGAALEVSALMREVDKHKGPLRVEGVVSKVFPKEQKLGLIDAAEFRKCGVVTCAEMVLPVQWNGAMPEVKSLVRLEGEIRDAGGKLEFVARSLEKVPAR